MTVPLEETRTDNSDKLIARMTDRYWRLNNLYFIKDKAGKKVKFKFNRFQQMLWDGDHTFNLVLKARQLGVTTYFCILYLDAVLFHKNQTAGIIAHRQDDAKKIFEDKIKFAFDNLPKELKAQLEVKSDSTEELSFRNGSKIFVSVSTRSAVVQYLHISEFGYTCKKFPDKAEEIISGALNSVEQGQRISIESTAKGRQGRFYDMCNEAEKLQLSGKQPNPLEFKFFFFAWWQNPEYTLESNDVFPKETQDYFDKLLIESNIDLTNGQKQWYFAKWKTQRSQMTSEYPSTPEEAFLSANEGTYYGKAMAKAIMDKRVGFVPHDPKLTVDTYWDLGRNDFTVILFVQSVGKEIRFINCYYSRLEGLSHYANILKKYRDDEGYHYGRHFLPHDVEVTELSTNLSRKSTLFGLGVSPIVVVPKLGIAEGIEMTRNIFPRFWFDESKCSKLIEWIENYQQEWDDKLGQAKDNPLHNEASHGADALRAVGVMFRDSGYIEEDSGFQKEEDRYGLFASLG